MTLLNWFSAKPRVVKNTITGSYDKRKILFVGHHAPVVALQQRQAPQKNELDGGDKLRRHSRRERLYIGIRDAMTQAGILSANYKSKAMSVDQSGNEFFVLIEVGHDFEREASALFEIEAQIIQTAITRFEIIVPAVYWRVDPSLRDERLGEPIKVDQTADFTNTLIAPILQNVVATPVHESKARSGLQPPLTDFQDTEPYVSKNVQTRNRTQIRQRNS